MPGLLFSRCKHLLAWQSRMKWETIWRQDEQIVYSRSGRRPTLGPTQWTVRDLRAPATMLVTISDAACVQAADRLSRVLLQIANFFNQAPQNPDANQIVFVGPNGNGEVDQNRIESGWNFNNPSSGSVCSNFPFSQKFSNPTATDWQCDEWPPALHQQPQPFGIRPYSTSLRCIPGGENGSLGAKLGNSVYSRGCFPGRPAGVIKRDDFFRVDFLSNIGTANQAKIQFCLGQIPNCSSDSLQFAMTAKTVGGGSKISS